MPRLKKLKMYFIACYNEVNLEIRTIFVPALTTCNET